jgi:hypothetical protein
MFASSKTAAAALALALSTSTAFAQTPLREVAHVRDGIISVGMAYEISEQCDDLSARLFRGLGYLQSLKRHASNLGYSRREKAFGKYRARQPR